MIRPWEVEAERYSYETRWGSTSSCVKEVIDDSNSRWWNRGDIVKFGSGYWGSYDYKDWFLTEDDKQQHMRRDPRVPKYAFNQFGILMTRYRVVKNKHGSIFRDYGSHIMMLTGQKIGRLRRYFTYHPYSKLARFPYQHNKGVVKEMLIDTGIDKIAYEIYSACGNTPESRTLFVATIQDKISEVHV